MMRTPFGVVLAAILFIGGLVSSVRAADPVSPIPAAPSLNDRLTAVDKLVKEKKTAEAEKELLALAKERAGNDVDLFRIYRKGMTIAGSLEKKEAMANKALALPTLTMPQRTEVLSALAGSVDYVAQLYRTYIDLLPEAVIKQMPPKELAYREELVKLNPGSAGMRIDLGNLYAQRGEADKADAEYIAALAVSNLPPMQQGLALVGRASAALLRKDRAGAVKALEDLVSRNLKTAGRGSPDPTGQARTALRFLKDAPDVDYMKLPWYTGGKVFPKAQQATYSGTFIPLTAAKLVLGKGLTEDDVRIELLKAKFARFGITIDSKASFAITINADPSPAAPEKPEGYALTVTKNGASINGRDKLGVTWGVVSLIQLFNLEKAGEPKIQLAEIVDYPDTLYRGCLAGANLESALFSKMNVIISERELWLTSPDFGRPRTPLMRETCKAMTETFDAFGLRLYFGICNYTMYPKMPLSSERTFDFHVKLLNEIADAKGHVYFPYDDGRFPLPPADLEKFGSAAHMDAKYLTRLYKEVKKDHPGFHLIFCPPFYWGPDSDAPYSEPREPYLKSLGEFLDPEIELFWTGPRVKGYEKNPEQVKWYTDLTKRKPVIFQNGTGKHNLWSYITDEMPDWKTWHYEGFLDRDLTGFLKNGGEIPQVNTLADCLWNIKGYDSAASIRAAVAMYYGKAMFDLIDPANKAMTKLDKYPYMEIRPGAAEEADEIARLSAEANAALDKAMAYNREALEGWGGHLVGVIRGSRNLAAQARKAPNLKATYGKAIDATRKFAVREVGIDEAKGDIFKSPVDLIGGELMEYEWRMISNRFASCIRGKASGISTLTTTFDCDPFPPSGPYVLNLSGLDDDQEKGVTLRISVNGKAIFEGVSTFERFAWSMQKFTIPFETLKRGNILVIEILDEGLNIRSGPPFFMVNYVVIKKAVQ